MSNDRAIAAVTSTLKSLIFAGVSADTTVAGAEVTARPPDRARQAVTGNQLNLFLYRTSLDAAWRNEDPPAARPGELGQPPLPIVLSYLVTAYGDNDDDVLSHRLLGIAMGVLNDRPVLSRSDIAAAGIGSDLETQVERVRITPHPIPLDEISRMWATFATGYRISVSYDAAVVLIDSTRTVLAPLPVLARGAADAGPMVDAQLAPALDLVSPPNGQSACRPGDTVTLTGRNLAGVTQVQITGIRLSEPTVLAVASVTASQVTAAIPTDPLIPAGTVAVTALSGASGTSGTQQLPSNAVPLLLAPAIVSSAALPATLKGTTASIQITCSPPVQAGQTIALIVGDTLFPGTAVASGSPAQTEVPFELTGLSAGTYTLRLRVDGADSIPLASTASDAATVMEFDPRQSLVLT
jgi:hypothetical protein